MTDVVSDVALDFTLNGRRRQLTVPVRRNLADLLREDVGLTGTRIGCALGVCGACVVLVDGTPSAACSLFAFQVQGADVQTIEGLASDAGLHAIQQAFIEAGAFQCGYCTSGMVMLTKALLDAHPHPDRATIVEWISSNVCRCTGYASIVDAVERAAGAMP